MIEHYSIVEKFEIANRGVVVAIDGITDRVPGRAYKVEIRGASGGSIVTEAFKEWLLRRNPTPIEKEAYTLRGVHKSDVPENAVLVFTEGPGT
ncbi:hypothetical protein [uncultured Microbulbifer sp.]|uniref:hypothetical protein n=1 Tax=uncultured Microbulbifer sp. TaxID=348147 RepID=UPI0025D28AF9|nr:hypothetical protein [uncultured Microbulbifer sp.]